MKTKFFKPILPLAAVVLAVAGAFAANVNNDVAKPDVIGYASLPGQAPCSTQVLCQTETAPICQIQHTNGLWYDAFQKVGTTCTTTRYNMRD
ncbi:DUF6520 family protein [Flavobacterium sp. AG291]|uniref:DUF6520 family protein n=1 Tax=Flavobacterium sp. AG291 TaxID=2184000 RepID=UPI000E0C500F|nr:DUF6520 family protein [Flavobacterium sp. AG291]RDI11242.1 hypothetical protein DEU42_106176 [Flavobacterium sp. AG291]